MARPRPKPQAQPARVDPLPKLLKVGRSNLQHFEETWLVPNHGVMRLCWSTRGARHGPIIVRDDQGKPVTTFLSLAAARRWFEKYGGRVAGAKPRSRRHEDPNQGTLL